MEVYVGKIFTKLTVIEKIENTNRWKCKCDCGNEVEVKGYNLKSGNNKSCGCLKRSVLGDATRTHGASNSRLTGYANRTYGIWQAMRARCKNPKNTRWSSYGGRGISICARWEDYTKFLADMGEAPKNLTLERINVNGNYEPTNCKWATWQEQAKNKRKK